jgi:hypothetical protein
MFASVVPERPIELTLYTDSYIARGTARTRTHRLTDVLNDLEHEFVVIEDAVLEEYGGRGEVVRAEFAQVNLDAVLFAVSDIEVEPVAELRVPKVAEQALITVPPFKVVGTIHLMPERDLREALVELTGRFIPITGATYWSDTIVSERTSVAVVACNRSRAQVFAPYRIVDPWAGMTTGTAPGAQATGTADSESTEAPTADGPAPWQG